MRVVVLGGAGAMGRWTVRDLVESEGVREVVVADIDGSAAREIAGWAAAQAGSSGSATVRGVAVDATDPAALRRALAGAGAVCNCCFHAFNVPVMQACAEVGAPYTDLGGLFHTTMRQLELHDSFVQAGVPAVIGMGGSPGTTNVMAARAARDLDEVHSVEVRLGIFDATPTAAPLAVPYAVRTLLDEFDAPAMTYRDGAFAEVPAMSEPEELDFPHPVGRVRVGHTLHSEVATLPGFLAGRGVADVSFKVGFPPELTAKLSLLAALGLAGTTPIEVRGPEGPLGPRVKVAPREVLVRCIEDRLPPTSGDGTPDDAEAFWVRVKGVRDGRATEVLAECVIRPNPAWGAGSGQVDTGVPPSIVAQLMAGGVIAEPGVHPPEVAVPPERYFEELARRGMRVELVTRVALTASTDTEGTAP